LASISPLIAKVALKFGAPELFALVLLGLTLICSFGQQSVIKGLMSGILGLIIMTVGLDPMMGTPRFTFGVIDLQAGVSFLPAMIGLFAIPQILVGIAGNVQVIPAYKSKISGVLPKIRDLFKLIKSMLIGATIGTGIGAIPGAGGPIAVFLSYDYAKRTSKKSDQFGKGEPEGVAAPEAANNAVAGGALIPMLTLGIPGDPITAILLAALMIQGLIPGPLLFQTSPQFVYSVFWAFLVANIMNLCLTMSTIKLWVGILKVPERVLLPPLCRGHLRPANLLFRHRYHVRLWDHRLPYEKVRFPRSPHAPGHHPGPEPRGTSQDVPHHFIRGSHDIHHSSNLPYLYYYRFLFVHQSLDYASLETKKVDPCKIEKGN
ncbi:MAG: tripartite tricarboxylate transporter permease, partial [Deltaproteobacteria bacterium]|nr:tripartite tricarboxylate transporter permease [Deltaproteobacteria bacterium]